MMTEAGVVCEEPLNDFDAGRRAAALEGLMGEVASGRRAVPAAGGAFNLHCHSFFSFNGYGLSPTALAWKGREAGLYAMGLVDFDVLDGVEEFLAACAQLGLRACAGIETRVFVPEFAERVINSPGEPGIAYHMGAGFVSSQAPDMVLLGRFKDIAQARTRGLVERVNAYLDPVRLDYERDVLPLTPKGNATERHVCMAYDAQARAHFSREELLAAFWAEKLGRPSTAILALLKNAPEFQGVIRGKTMKQGGPGYVRPEGGDFPRVEEVNQFVLEAGAIPTLAWLDGTSAGEQSLDELLSVMMASGVAAVNVIPDRNWNLRDPDEKRLKVAKLNEFVEAARARNLPILVGTEMNAYGQRFVDDFEAPELAPLYPIFLEAVHILHAHTKLQARAGMGYCSAWAGSQFGSTAEKYAFFEKAGRKIAPGASQSLAGINDRMSADAVLAALG
ncbi:MAG: hypothetical protein HYV26_21695 [Candidatus Hydrogenedentes bacterium]|nr:hypothetical protein [Candidatus Hydrogenedentota bacterium]